ncbi:MAG TPA: universal stress protein [Desulfuromonadales bacterium]|nr:universal stress protein [Desulfuromonadales bacterium]
MGLKDILVHLDNSSAAAARLDLAVSYARKHDARLRGLYLTTHSYYESSNIGEKGASASLEELFTSRTSAAGVDAEWVHLDSAVVGSNVSDFVALQAYYTDLIIVGQTNHSSPALNVPVDLPERLVLICGRPVLVVPYAGSFSGAAERVMIAWKAGRESIRAINDAMPCLEKAQHVKLIGVGTSNTPAEPFGGIVAQLACHGVKVATDQVNADNFPIGDMILNNVCEQKIDLLVMGAYAPNRRGVLEVSPVARHILKHLTVPVLLSH